MSSDDRGSEWKQGYKLLYDLISQEAHADKILWIKFESDSVDSLMKEIVELCEEGAETIESWTDAEELVDLDSAPLPAIEREARSEIESETAGELFGSSGQEFELRLLITQLRALRYAATLSRVLARHEYIEQRRQFLEQFDERCSALREGVFATILERRATRP